MARHLRAFAVATSIAAVTALTLTTGPVAGASGADWTQEGGSAARRRWNRNEVTITKSNVKNLKPGWSAGVPVGGAEWEVISAPEAVVTADRVVSVATSGTYGAGYVTTVRSSNPATGARQWSREFNGRAAGAPALVDGRLIVGVVRPYDAVFVVWCLRPGSGEILWARLINTDYSSAVNVGVEGALVVATGFSGGTFTAAFLDATSGNVRATVTGGDTDTAGGAGPTIKNGITYLTGGANPPGAKSSSFSWSLAYKPYGARLGTWKLTQMGDAPALPVATSERVYFPDKMAVYGINPSTGAVQLAITPTAAEGHFRTPFDAAVDADRIYLGYLRASDNVRTVTAFNRFTGARVWSRAATVKAAPTVANGVLYVAEGVNGVAAYNAATGAELWRKPGIANSAAPVVANGRLYVGWTASGNPDEPAPLMMFRL